MQANQRCCLNYESLNSEKNVADLKNKTPLNIQYNIKNIIKTSDIESYL